MDITLFHPTCAKKGFRANLLHGDDDGIFFPAATLGVYQVLEAFERKNHVKIPIRKEGRREGGDICYADVNLAWQELGWMVELGLLEMVRHAYNTNSTF